MTRARLPRNTRTVVAIAIAVLAGAGIGVLLVPRAPTPDDRSERPPEVTLLGSPLPLDASAKERALERVRQFVRVPFTLELPDQLVKSYSLSQLGAKIDLVRLSELVRDAQDKTSPLRRVWKASPAGAALALPNPVELDPDQALFELLKLKDSLDRQPVDARLNLVTVAAFLTLIGYSINDTIVIFDRIRENRGTSRERLEEILDASVNQTLSRTIRTTGSTLVVEFRLRLPLAPGSYSISSAIAPDRYSRAYFDWVDNALIVTVSPPDSGKAIHGQVWLPVEIAVHPS